MKKEGKPQRTFIENFLPVKEISTETEKEKSGRPPTFKMHYWWTRINSMLWNVERVQLRQSRHKRNKQKIR